MDYERSLCLCDLQAVKYAYVPKPNAGVLSPPYFNLQLLPNETMLTQKLIPAVIMNIRATMNQKVMFVASVKPCYFNKYGVLEPF